MYLLTAAAAALIVAILWDAFEVIILPRRVTRAVRFSRLFYGLAWRVWAAAARRVPTVKRRDAILSYYGPLSLILLLFAWAVGLVFGFGALEWSLGVPVTWADGGPAFSKYVYLSGVTFTTLGYGDAIPADALGRTFAVAEAGVGFGFLAIVIGYLPVLYTSFSAREVNITLLDSRAGSPPSAHELLRRHGHGHADELRAHFADWERWAAELLESHLSFPILCYFRSQHDNQSWLGGLTAVIDACAFAMAYLEGPVARQAQLTFAIARHAVVDIAQILDVAPKPPAVDRLAAGELAAIRVALADAGYSLRSSHAADVRFGDLRQMYEPYVVALGEHLMMSPPAWVPPRKVIDNWQTSAWERSLLRFDDVRDVQVEDVH